jgi:hypothetical protein
MIWFGVAKLVAARLVVVPIRCGKRVIDKRWGKIESQVESRVAQGGQQIHECEY